MKYIFLYRRITDVDHIAPIIYSLLSNGVDPKKIYYTDYFIDKTTLNLKNDPRLKFLIKFNINFSQTFFNNYYKIVNTNNIKSYVLKKLLNLSKFTYYKFISFYYFAKILKIILLTSYKNKIIVDELNHPFLLNLIKLLNKNVISVPHGIVLHNGELKDRSRNFSFILPDLRKLNKYKHLIFYNNISLHVHEYHISNLSILGTARYCKEWTEVQKSFYPKINALFKNNNLNVLFLLEKSNYIKIDNNYVEIIKSEEIYKTIDYIISSGKFNLIIKSHPSSKIDQKLENKKNVLIVDNDEDYKTFQLADYADITLGIKSGAICDAILLNKPFLLLDYCHPYALIINEYLDKTNISESFEDFKIKLNHHNQIHKINSNFINKYLGAEGKNILNNYYNFLSKS